MFGQNSELEIVAILCRSMAVHPAWRTTASQKHQKRFAPQVTSTNV